MTRSTFLDHETDHIANDRHQRNEDDRRFVSMMKKVSKVVDVHDTASQDRSAAQLFQRYSHHREDTMAPLEFQDALRRTVNGVLREPDLQWLTHKLAKNRDGTVNYRTFLREVHRCTKDDSRDETPTTGTDDSSVPHERLDPWGRPLNLAASARTAEQSRFESSGVLGGSHGRGKVSDAIRPKAPSHRKARSINPITGKWVH